MNKFFTQYDSCVSADNKTLSEKYYVEYQDSSPKEYLSDYPLEKYQ